MRQGVGWGMYRYKLENSAAALRLNQRSASQEINGGEINTRGRFHWQPVGKVAGVGALEHIT